MFSIDHSITAATATASMKSKEVTHLADGFGLEPLRAGRDVEFIVLILLLQERRKKVLVDFTGIITQTRKKKCFVFLPGSQIDTGVITCKASNT